MRRSSIFWAIFIGLYLALGGFAVYQYRQTILLRQQLSNRFAQSFAELTTAVGELDAALTRGRYATTANMVGHSCTEIFGKAQAAATAASALPYSHRELPDTNAFLSQVADYALATSKAAQSGQDYDSTAQRENLSTLSARCSALSDALLGLQAQLHDGQLSLAGGESAMTQLAQRIEPALKADGAVPALSGQGQKESVEDSHLAPTLIYDGPFSDHILGQTIKLLEGRPTVSEAEALEKAAAFFGLQKASLSVAGTVEGRIPAYLITGSDARNEVTITVSRQGGEVLQMLSSHAVGAQSLTPEEGVQRAATFLAERGFHNMHRSYHINQNGALTVNFSATQDDIILYPDLIKVTVALDDGRIMGYEAKGYLSNHSERNWTAVSVSEERASEAVSTDLDILSIDLAVIPTPGKNEVLCYEFATEAADGKHHLIYVNVANGLQEKILILLEDENGTLTL